MPSLKRVQVSEDSEETDGSMSSKRQRTNSGLSGSGSSPAAAPNFLAVDDEILSDDELELRQTQIIQEKYSHHIEEANVPAEHGILERVECYNFMCHDHFNIELGPLINFIVGKNGSGKSAILTAIVLCLGGKAAATNRGQSLKSFIKEGKENAQIIVRIKNQGDGAYMSDDYGKSIVVERHFNTAGNSQFKIKAENGRIVSTKKAELDAITDYFSLQIDNPMNVLSQDMARQFLSTSSPAEKYKFFVKGVQLEQLDQDYRLIEESVDQIEEKLRASATDIAILEDRKVRAQKKLEASDQHDSLRAKVRSIRSQMAWAQVEEQERMVIELADAIAISDQKIAEAESDLTRFDTLFDEVETEGTAADEHAWRAAVAFKEAEEAQKEVKERQAEELARRTELQVPNLSQSFFFFSKRADGRNPKKIDSEKQRLAEVSNGGYARKENEWEQAVKDASMAKDTYNEHRNGAAGLHSEAEVAERQDSEAWQPIELKNKEIEQAKSQLENLNRQGGEMRTGRHPKIPTLLREIQKERHFPVFIGSGGRLDTTGKEPDPQFDTVLRTLQIDNELVRRQLIINNGIDQMLLIEDRETASTTLFDGARPRNVPVSSCRMDQGSKDEIRFCLADQREIVADLERQLGDLEKEAVAARSRRDKCKLALARHSRIQNDLRLAMQQAEDHAEGLREALDKENADDGSIDALQEALKEAESELQLNEGSYGDAQAAMTAKMQTLKEIMREINAQTTALDALKVKVNVAESEKNVVENKRRTLHDHKNAAIGLIDNDKAQRANLVQKREQVQARVEEYNEKAAMVSDRVPVDEGETSSSLERKLETLQRDINRYNTQLGASRAEIAAEAAKTATAYSIAASQVEELSSLAHRLKDTLSNRKKRWEIFRSHISSRAKAQFTYLLSERSFRGRLLTDHVEPDITKDDSTGRGAKTLSGGEKSFSQVCILLSLWEAMGSPIRCLDEFDVYMDHINRKMSIDMLMVAARRSIGRQFILITPGSKTDITISPDVVVKELAAPERGQTRLNFQ
ncbi:RecF/RecN/SMC [Penicillium soppii]|uniref:RecF/RecN/SMC n=1 Tax=Penicillium soppii TaxID=69789 RepID=UPI0025476EA2|nr:RecF/RecN/SMC [Penicillium soppii]KAJ5864325.1 RecF/RecN/SMC [Penicillium soppii]